MTGNAWWGPGLDNDHRALRTMLDDFAAAHEPVLADDPDVVCGLVAELAALGVRTLGTAESAGGGGADRVATVVALERLGRFWPALGWAAAQAHSAVDVLAGDDRFAALVSGLHDGTEAVAVVDSGSVHVRLDRDGDSLIGSVDRVDAAAERPHLLILGNDDTAELVTPDALTPTPLRRTGFDGALTRSLEVRADDATVHRLTGVDGSGARMRLRVGAAAVAAGISGAAVDAALAYTAERHQFGAALTALPTVRQSLLGQAARATVALSAAVSAADEVQAYAAMREACDGAVDTAAAALQAHGGYGYLTEYGAERRLRDAVSLRAAADTQGAALTTARTLVGLAPVDVAVRKEAS